ncbi:MAG TPA: glycosyltransferase [Dermatophilaceae bacterium]|jgi:cellulose synthase/poly-beta-1,6-N-acetylglucosamine synthase-like glycosyltransferase/CheY-like chemotaxis protein
MTDREPLQEAAPHLKVRISPGKPRPGSHHRPGGVLALNQIGGYATSPPAVLGLEDQPGQESAALDMTSRGLDTPPSFDGLSTRSNTILLVHDDSMMLPLLKVALERTGHTVDTAQSGVEALHMVDASPPDIVVCDVAMPGMDGFEFMQQLRTRASTATVPLIFLAAQASTQEAVRSLALGADDYIRTQFSIDEIVARVEAKLARPTIAADQVPRPPRTGLVTEVRLYEELAREIERSHRSGRSGCIAALDLAERPAVAARLGARADQDLRVQVSVLAATGAEELDLIGQDAEGRLLVLMPETDPDPARERLLRLSQHVAHGSFTAAGEPVHVTPVVGFATFGAAPGGMETVIDRALVAANVATVHLDLQPVAWRPEFEATGQRPPLLSWATRLRARLRTPVQVALSFVIGVLLPFLAYVALDSVGIDVTRPVYYVVVAALLLTGVLIWVEGFQALDPERPPEDAALPFPPASAVIAAYLPNEAATIVETVEAFLRLEYPGPLQIVLAYNTPRPMPVESALSEIARRDRRFIPYRVEESTSKAQNVNAALGQVTGEFVGVFDADHHPAPDAFHRAWRWLASGYDVVQGHCVVRNGDASWVSRTVAVEFESIYAVSHPGRTRLHRFGIFGGSNGYWRTDLLRKVRMHGFMLTEDIDSSLRVIEAGGKIASDPALVSRELAPTTLPALWNQRMRWAQGWFQVSRKHLRLGWGAPSLTRRQKLGFTLLLGWRELYPWLSLQILPLVCFFAWKAGGVTHLNLLIPLFFLTTAFTLSVGPGQTYFAHRLAVPEIRRRGAWFLAYLVVSSVFYTEWKNVISRVAQIKELTGDRQWKVTPRTTLSPLPVDTQEAVR